ncbi:hypothetical protein M1D55_20035 [Cupriavidus sp. JZ107]
MQTNRIAPQTIRPQLSPSEDPGALTQQDIDELTALVQPELERAGTWGAGYAVACAAFFPVFAASRPVIPTACRRG